MLEKYKYVISKEISREKLENIIVDGYESGIGYWATLCNDTPMFKKYYDTTNFATSKIICKLILDDNISIHFRDRENDEDTKYCLSLNRLLEGIKLNEINRSFDCDLNDYDACTCDCIFQYALYGEVVFG